jgi:hypothetical protein
MAMVFNLIFVLLAVYNMTSSVLRLYIQKILPSSHCISNSLKRYTEEKYPSVLSGRFPVLIFVAASNLPPIKLFWNVIPCSLVGNDHCCGGWRMWRSNLPPVYWTPRVGAFFVSTTLRTQFFFISLLIHNVSISFAYCFSQPFLIFSFFVDGVA